MTDEEDSLLDFDSYNLKTLIYQGIKTPFFVYSTTALLGINSEVLTPEARTFLCYIR
jgi:hypothetical protein